MFEVQRQIEWGECDALGIVFYPNFYRWMDGTFHLLTRAAGFDQQSLSRDFGVAGTPLVEASCRFLAPARFYETVSVAAGIARLGKSSLALDYRFAVAGAVIAEGREVRSFVRGDGAAIGKAEIPDAIRASLEMYRAR